MNMKLSDVVESEQGGKSQGQRGPSWGSGGRGANTVSLRWK